MHRLAPIFAAGLFALGVEAAARKNNVSVGDARRELGIVAAYQGFPERHRISRFAVLEAEGEYYHIFTAELPKARIWRTLVYANSGDYLGYYETVDPPVAYDADALIYAGGDYSSENGDFVEGLFDSGNAYTIRFSAAGPPDEVVFENCTFRFISSPRRIRPDDPAYRFVRLANRLADAINSGRYKTVREYFSAAALARIPEEATVKTLEGVRKKLGRIERVGDPWVQSADTAVLPIIFNEAAAGLKLQVTDDAKIIGLWVQPFKTAFPDIGKNTTPIRLPFDGQWRVLWGGDTRDTSKYFGSRVSHNACEFVVANRFRKTFRNEGRDNRDYFAFGRIVRAPASGTVVGVINGVEDNRPHAPNSFDRLGNAVMIEHSLNEYSVVGHLMKDSITVAVGERVTGGHPIARCGNSGDSSQPSVYFHLQDSARLLAGSGYRPLFRNLYLWKSGGIEVVAEHAPLRGEYVQQRSVSVKGDSAWKRGNSEE
ncbi:peptidoglycan DD-metalloendopeptidase family protein [Pontiella agarivorans]|uniref:Peptidoglycan DD-metalloendopeptidase family protein n=1 Tax=Pontiella agarivorans TaxID=3038953 RepID=A0ABU5MV60_9BACT|nr:peptidoglycan DD-metalloendopeptidase family protein [Pontiella agarivorans]MDZ8118114.1 peptidoglycan DD-metalloendopeptidase family protein [Pontiella agarivorans]